MERDQGGSPSDQIDTSDLVGETFVLNDPAGEVSTGSTSGSRRSVLEDIFAEEGASSDRLTPRQTSSRPNVSLEDRLWAFENVTKDRSSLSTMRTEPIYSPTPFPNHCTFLVFRVELLGLRDERNF